MIRIFQSSWFASVVGAALYLATTLALMEPVQFQSALAWRNEAHFAPVEPSWQFRNPELSQWLDEVKHEKEALAAREQQLKEYETRLEAERQEVRAMTQTVQKLQSEFDRNVVRVKEQEVDNLKRQAKVIASMSPEGAAALVGEMADDDVVRVMMMMKPDDASLILDTLSRASRTAAKRAATITERMRMALPPAPPTRANANP